MESCDRFQCVRLDFQGHSFADGSLWEKVPFVYLTETETGNPPRLQTRVRAAYELESNALYFFFEGEDDGILSEYTNRDDPIYLQDVYEIFITDSDDRTRYKEFEVSPTNTRFDADIHYHSQEKIDVRTKWDLAGWETVTRFDADSRKLTSYWKLPLEGWARTPRSGDVWTINAYRIDHSDFGEELQAWSPTHQRNFHVPECFGELYFV